MCASLSLFFSPYSFVSFSSHPHTVFVLLIGALQVYYFAPCFLNVFYSARLPINSSSVFTFTHTHIRVRTLNTHTRSVYICYHSKVLVITRARVRVREREHERLSVWERNSQEIHTHTHEHGSQWRKKRATVRVSGSEWSQQQSCISTHEIYIYTQYKKESNKWIKENKRITNEWKRQSVQSSIVNSHLNNIHIVLCMCIVHCSCEKERKNEWNSAEF